MKGFRELDRLLKGQDFAGSLPAGNEAEAYARAMAAVENVVAVVSDLRRGTSWIFAGAFAQTIGLEDYSEENSIWEKEILARMSASGQEEKYLAELRFFNYIRRLPLRKRGCYHLVTRLRFNCPGRGPVEVLHRMYYIHEGDTVRFAICLYGPLPADYSGRSAIVNSVTGTVEEIRTTDDAGILTPREKQVLSLIGCGRTSAGIAGELGISIHTVSRHRQEILGKLRAGNSHEAFRIARSLGII